MINYTNLVTFKIITRTYEQSGRNLHCYATTQQWVTVFISFSYYILFFLKSLKFATVRGSTWIVYI